MNIRAANSVARIAAWPPRARRNADRYRIVSRGGRKLLILEVNDVRVHLLVRLADRLGVVRQHVCGAGTG